MRIIFKNNEEAIQQVNTIYEWLTSQKILVCKGDKTSLFIANAQIELTPKKELLQIDIAQSQRARQSLFFNLVRATCVVRNKDIASFIV